MSAELITVIWVCFFQKPDLHSAPPDVTTGLVGHSPYERPQMASVRGIPRGHGRNVLETADGKRGTSLSSETTVQVSL